MRNDLPGSCGTWTRCGKWTKRALRRGSTSWMKLLFGSVLSTTIPRANTRGTPARSPRFRTTTSSSGRNPTSSSSRRRPRSKNRRSWNCWSTRDRVRPASSIARACWGGWMGSTIGDHRQSVLGRLDGFNYWGSAVGVMPTLDFPAVRRFLLGLLAECPSDQWLSTSALVEHLKKHHRSFLIPAKPRFKNEHDARSGRYGNFHESKDAWGHGIDIHESDPDGFERVEGRYVERFLEGIPLVLRYVDVAYARKPPRAIYPSLGCLQAFRVSDRLRRALAGRIVEPRVTVSPNFDVHVIAEAYPAGVLAQLAPLCEMVSQGTSIILKLTKQKVAAARAVSPDLDATGVLRALVGGELPANIVHELSAWSEHGEKFALYVNCSVLETDQDLPVADPFTVERVAAGIRLVRSPDKLFDELERRELMPVRIKHGDQAFAPVPKSAWTRFPKGSASRAKPREPKPRVTLTRMTRVQLVCPDRELLD